MPKYKEKPVDILKERYSKGEISKEEYQDAMDTLYPKSSLINFDRIKNRVRSSKDTSTKKVQLWKMASLASLVLITAIFGILSLSDGWGVWTGKSFIFLAIFNTIATVILYFSKMNEKYSLLSIFVSFFIIWGFYLAATSDGLLGSASTITILIGLTIVCIFQSIHLLVLVDDKPEVFNLDEIEVSTFGFGFDVIAGLLSASLLVVFILPPLLNSIGDELSSNEDFFIGLILWLLVILFWYISIFLVRKGGVALLFGVLLAIFIAVPLTGFGLVYLLPFFLSLSFQ